MNCRERIEPQMIYQHFIRPAMFLLDAERAHDLAIYLGARFPRLLLRLLRYGNTRLLDHPSLSVRLGDLTFPRPVGVAAGLDKNGEIAELLSRCGSGFVEIGSVSRYPSLGNARPRLFRLPADHAVVVNYGNPSHGADRVQEHLSRQRLFAPLGVNLVPTNDQGAPTLAATCRELAEAARILTPCADYFMLNLSCPNVRELASITPGSPHTYFAALSLLLRSVCQQIENRPVFLKLHRTAEPMFIERLLDVCQPISQVRGFAFNLTRSRAYCLRTPSHVIEKLPGVIAGPHTANAFNDTISSWYRHTKKTRFVLIGGGGVFSAADAYQKIRLGAQLVQVCTAVVYQGPMAIGRFNDELANLVHRDGFTNVSQAVGVDVD